MILKLWCDEWGLGMRMGAGFSSLFVVDVGLEIIGYELPKKGRDERGG